MYFIGLLKNVFPLSDVFNWLIKEAGSDVFNWLIKEPRSDVFNWFINEPRSDVFNWLRNMTILQNSRENDIMRIFSCKIIF